jgi:RNA polymerase sigma-70 factor (ECF subfamily)
LEKYSDFLASAARNYLSDKEMIMDALQETWIIIFNNIQGYEERGYFYPWAKKILLREIIRISKKEKAKEVFIGSLKTKDQVFKPSIERKLELQEVMKLVEKLRSPAREVFKLHVIDGLSHKEIGDLMNIKDSTSRVHLTNARKELKELILIRDKRKAIL